MWGPWGTTGKAEHVPSPQLPHSAVSEGSACHHRPWAQPALLRAPRPPQQPLLLAFLIIRHQCLQAVLGHQTSRPPSSPQQRPCSRLREALSPPRSLFICHPRVTQLSRGEDRLLIRGTLEEAPSARPHVHRQEPRRRKYNKQRLCKQKQDTSLGWEGPELRQWLSPVLGARPGGQPAEVDHESLGLLPNPEVCGLGQVASPPSASASSASWSINADTTLVTETRNKMRGKWWRGHGSEECESSLLQNVVKHCLRLQLDHKGSWQHETGRNYNDLRKTYSFTPFSLQAGREGDTLTAQHQQQSS